MNMTTNYHRLSFAEREEISKGIFAKESFTEITRRLNRSISTISNEVHIQVKRKRWCYSAIKGQELANEKRKIQGRKRKLDNNERLLSYIQTKLRKEWSPEEIAERLKLDYANDMAMRISHESIYQYLYCLPRGELKKELMKGC